MGVAVLGDKIGGREEVKRREGYRGMERRIYITPPNRMLNFLPRMGKEGGEVRRGGGTC